MMAKNDNTSNDQRKLHLTPSAVRFIHLLDCIRLDGIKYSKALIPNGRRIAVPDKTDAYLYYIEEGSVSLKLAHNKKQYELKKGDILLLPFGCPHEITPIDSANLPLSEEPLTLYQPEEWNNLPEIKTANSKINARLLIGHVSPEDNLASLGHPDVALVPYSQKNLFPRLFSIIEALSIPGSGNYLLEELVRRRLSEVIAIELATATILSQDCYSEWMIGITDQHIGKALNAMHTNPRKQINLQNFALELGTSRSVFIKKFHDLIGMPPHQYLRKLRLLTAASLIREDKYSLAQIPEEVGYSSGSAFYTAFTKQFGMTPGQYRIKIHGAEA